MIESPAGPPTNVFNPFSILDINGHSEISLREKKAALAIYKTPVKTNIVWNIMRLSKLFNCLF